MFSYIVGPRPNTVNASRLGKIIKGRFWDGGKEKQPYRVTQSGQDRSREGA
jgi:hypothetical protein